MTFAFEDIDLRDLRYAQTSLHSHKLFSRCGPVAAASERPALAPVPAEVPHAGAGSFPSLVNMEIGS